MLRQYKGAKQGYKQKQVLLNQFPVLILNYMRPKNLTEFILPALLKESAISKIIIAHGRKDTVFGVDELEDGEIKQVGAIWHIGNYAKNDEYRCFRRWDLVYSLREKGILTEECIFIQDDDIMFHFNEINKLYKNYEQHKGVLISGSFGRNIQNNNYDAQIVSGKCDIVIGQSIFGSITTICNAVKEIRAKNIPTELLCYEDDITMCYFTLKDKKIKNKQHFSSPLKYTGLSENDAVCSRPDHLEMRNRTLTYLLNLSV